jgi:hypothetical protein
MKVIRGKKNGTGSTSHRCHGPQKRAIQSIMSLIRRADARRLGGPVKPGHDN